MDRQWLGGAVGAALLAASLAASAEVPPTESTGCRAPPHDGPLLADRQARIAQYEELGESCLKRLLLACEETAQRQVLDSGAAFACSIGYEALLRRGFGGDFQSMLAWWRQRREGKATVD